MDNRAIERIKPQVRGLKPYTLVQYPHRIKLNQNESPFDIPQGLKEEILEMAKSMAWHRYPGFTPTELVAKLSACTGVGGEGILVGNGSNELIQAVFMAAVSKGSKVVIPVPTFRLYELLGTVMEADLHQVRLRGDLSFDVERIIEEIGDGATRLVVLASPNSPTGSVLEVEEVEEVLKATDGLVVIDEAYQEFSGQTNLGLLKKYDNLIILRTFSKAMGLAGLRVGYLLTNPPLAWEISKAKLPYNLNFFSMMVAMRLLDETKLLEERIEYIRKQRGVVFHHLEEIPGMKPYPSLTNFILFKVDKPVSHVFHGLIQRGILIRDVSSYPMLSRALRVTIGLDEENQAFLGALREIMEDVS